MLNNSFNYVEIFLVADNTGDAEPTIGMLRKVNLFNNLIHPKNGAEALDQETVVPVSCVCRIGVSFSFTVR